MGMRSTVVSVLGLLVVAGCGGAQTAGEAAKREPVCLLVDGELQAWRGLPAHTLDALPACLGERQERASMRYHGLDLDVDRYRPALGVDVWVYGAVADGKVMLVEIRREAPLRAERVLAALGEPDTTYRWSADDRNEAGPAAAFVTRDPELAVDEAVYGQRGLALSVARRDAAPAVVFRTRGFTPDAADAYLDELVRLQPAATD